MATTPTISKIVQILICLGLIINHDQHTQDNVEQSRTHSTNNITCDFRAKYTIPAYNMHKLLSVYMLPQTQIYQDHNVSYSKNQITILTIPLL